MLYYGERVLLSLWVGALWAIGYLAVPTLFAVLDDRMLAGMLAGRMFTATSFIGLGVGTVLLLMAVMATARPLAQWRVRLLLLMLVLVAVGEFVLQPMMAGLKAEGLVEGSGAAARFALLHGVASLLYLVNSIAGLVLLVLYLRSPSVPLRAGG
ncbi:MAG: DUF4149 domain-containing protein [Pseudomonadota bacterium]